MSDSRLFTSFNTKVTVGEPPRAQPLPRPLLGGEAVALAEHLEGHPSSWDTDKVRKAARLLRALASPPPVSGTPDFETAARALGFKKLPSGRWYLEHATPGVHADHETFWESPEAIFDWWGKANGGPVSGDVRAATIEECATVSVKLMGLGSRSDDYLRGFQDGCNAKADAISALSPSKEKQ